MIQNMTIKYADRIFSKIFLPKMLEKDLYVLENRREGGGVV